ncbi:uncharacterized protein BCR38DRAFT_432898 [Pseudomassariella vexata]|uniref:Histone deacetylase complex subunit SAP30 Sin3 binding domain-containing protein n=1 Tax=Pseudomassariella vexata TaxID=1141098 RepID=A0A1Y2E1Q3_9PEZI|nr:uncharacterized protein BCR38DRAFT_432898 [Pseudomassariella vexata]ORY65478.1 hypothetical protein BCR38DRAFT_432898 [Pseudomassariella vexata]
MPPKSKTNHDDAKSETPSVKERNGHGSYNHHHSSGKLRRVASSTGSQLRDVTSINGQESTATAATAAAVTQPGLQWSSFDRDVLHEYRREYRLDTPTAFSNSYHQWVLSRPGVGLHSPTMARKQEYRRQSKEDLAKVVRKHFNGVGIQENDVVVGFLHKVRCPGVIKPRRDKKKPHSSPMP